MRTNEFITLCYLRGQSIKLLCWCFARVLWSRQLPFAKGMHDFNPRDRTARCPEGLEAEHGTRQPFHGSMILLHDIIEILGVADDNRGPVRLVIVLNRCRVAPTLIDGDFLRQPLGANGFV